jgi:hypothetical protein
MVSPDDGWVSGDIGDFLHWDGTAWEQAYNPTQWRFNSIFMVSPSDGWAVADAVREFYTRSTIAHWDGQAWWNLPVLRMWVVFGMDDLSREGGQLEVALSCIMNEASLYYSFSSCPMS